MAFDSGVTHYDEPPPDVIEDLHALRDADRFRFANVLKAWVDVDDDGRIADYGYDGGGLMGSTSVGLGHLRYRFEAVALPDIQQRPEKGRDWVRFSQTAGGRTGMPAPRRVKRRPFIQWQAPLVWTTLSLTLHADGSQEFALSGASRFPRHWVYDAAGALALKSGLTDYKDWYRKSFGRHTPWGDQESEALVTAVESALERRLSTEVMHGTAKPKFVKVKAGEFLTREGEEGTDVYLILDGVLRVERGDERLAEYGPGAILGERAHLEDGTRSSSLVAITACRVAAVDAELLERGGLEELSKDHRREDNR